VRPDRLSELEDGSLSEIIGKLGRNETITIEFAEKKGIRLARRDTITFWQALLAATWFPILLAFLTAYIWTRDPSGSRAVVQLARDHLAITITGMFAGWIVSMGVVVYLFRYIRQS
jgi:hypothetical protein